MLLSIGEKMNKKADERFIFITIILIIVIVIVGILIHSKVYAKADKFVTSCNGAPPFVYKCADEIDPKSTVCPPEWSVDSSKDCPEKDDIKPECCYRTE